MTLFQRARLGDMLFSCPNTDFVGRPAASRRRPRVALIAAVEVILRHGRRFPLLTRAKRFDFARA